MKKKIGVHLAHGNKRSVKTRKSSLADRIITLVEEAKRKVVSAVNVALVYTYYEVGRMIVEEEQGGKKRAQYGKAQLQELSKKLTERFGKGWSVENLKLMRRLFLVYSQENQNAVLGNSPNSVNHVYPIDETDKYGKGKISNSPIPQTGFEESDVSPRSVYPFRLSWSHYLVLMRMDNPDERRFYEIEAAENGWDLDELKRQFNSSLYERLALSRDKNDAIVEMTLPQGSKRIFASKYMTVLPDKETLRLLVRKQLGGEK